MAFMLAPGVQFTEKDLTSIIPAVSTAAGAYAGVFRWGPVMNPTTISSENELVQKFGSPNNGTALSFFSAANFLSYSNSLLLVRLDTTDQKNAVAIETGGITAINITEAGTGYTEAPTVLISAPQVTDGVQATATAVVADGAVTEIIITEAGSGYTSATVSFSGAGTGAEASAVVTVSGIKINNNDIYSTNYENGAGIVGEFAAKYPGSLGNSLLVSMADSNSFDAWTHREQFDSDPGDDEVHVIVIDEDGVITGTQNGILEKFAYLGKASDARRSDGSNAYYKFVINNTSKWVYWMDHPEGMDWGKESGPAVTFTDLAAPVVRSLSGGVDDFSVTEGQKQLGFELFDNAESYDISLIFLGKATGATATYVINNVAEKRRDCVVFVSPENVTTGEAIVGLGTDTSLAEDIVLYRNQLPSTSYAVLDSGWKYQYDRYNDLYRWIPLNADIAGLCARTDFTDDPWFSPGGYNRGQIKNVTKLAYNPNETARTILYKNGINPVSAIPGEGTVLMGDKTLLSRPSAFDRINVRRLFIVLAKAIATAAKYQLFEFNDEFTRNRFKGMVEPFLRDVQGRRGVTDFRVKCDETNNTGEVIDGNRFVADIFVKPNRSINFITLNFVAARTSVSFEEIGA